MTLLEMKTVLASMKVVFVYMKAMLVATKTNATTTRRGRLARTRARVGGGRNRTKWTAASKAKEAKPLRDFPHRLGPLRRYGRESKTPLISSAWAGEMRPLPFT